MQIIKNVVILLMLLITKVQASEERNAFFYSLNCSLFQSSALLIGAGFGVKAGIDCFVKKEPLNAFKNYCVFKALVDSAIYLQGCKKQRLNMIQDETRRNNYKFHSSLIGWSVGIGLCSYGLYKIIGGIPQLNTGLL